MATSTPVPLLDVNRQNAPLQAEMQAALAEVCESGAFVHGPACHEFETALAEYCGVQHAIGCASGSDALLLALLALEIGPGDEVVLPELYLFCDRQCGDPSRGDPRLCGDSPGDVQSRSGGCGAENHAPNQSHLPVHLFGQCADLEALGQIAQRAGGVPIIEDAAQAIGAEYQGRRAGAIGSVGCFSFYPTKNLGGCGDGGMLTTNDDALAARLRILRDHGQHPRYHHSLVGLNSRLDAFQAAVLKIKLSKLDGWAAARQQNAARYGQQFEQTGLAAELVLPEVATDCVSVWNQFTVRVRDGQRDAVQQSLAARQIGSAVYYPIPLHLQECFAFLGYQPGSLPITEQACQEVLSLPIYGELTRGEQDQVVAALAEFYGLGSGKSAAQHAA